MKTTIGTSLASWDTPENVIFFGLGWCYSGW